MKSNHQRLWANSRKAKKSTRRINPKTKVRRKERNLSNATVVVVLIILQRSTIYLQYLVGLYQKSLKEAEKDKGSFETHFNTTSDEAATLGKRPDEVAKPSLTVKNYIDRENMIIEYNSNDVFGDQD
jgi:hypothetical protein